MNHRGDSIDRLGDSIDALRNSIDALGLCTRRFSRRSGAGIRIGLGHRLRRDGNGDAPPGPGSVRRERKRAANRSILGTETLVVC